MHDPAVSWIEDTVLEVYDLFHTIGFFSSRRSINSEHFEDITIWSCHEVLLISKPVLLNDLLEAAADVRISEYFSIVLFLKQKYECKYPYYAVLNS